MVREEVGDVTDLPDGKVIVAHVCNEQGYWGAGVSGAIGKKWPKAERMYREWARERNPLPLGAVQWVAISDDHWVANLIAQVGIRSADNRIPLRYVALAECLNRLMETAAHAGASVQLPRIGAGLAGGDWSLIYKLIVETSETHGVDVCIVSLP